MAKTRSLLHTPESLTSVLTARAHRRAASLLVLFPVFASCAAPLQRPAPQPQSTPQPAYEPMPRPQLEPPHWLHLVVEDAVTLNRPLVIEVHATWCPSCEDFDAKVLPLPQVQEALARVLHVRYDVDTPVGAEAADYFQATEVPAFFAVDRHGRVRLQLMGIDPGVEDFLGFLARAHEVFDSNPTRSAQR